MSQPIDFILVFSFLFHSKLKQWSCRKFPGNFRAKKREPCPKAVKYLLPPQTQQVGASEGIKLLNFNSISLFVVRLLLFVIARSLARPLVSF
jgi:hypothetical protein